MSHSQLQFGTTGQTTGGVPLANVLTIDSCNRYRNTDWITAQTGTQTTTIADSDTTSGVAGSTIKTLLVNATDCLTDLKVGISIVR